MKHRIDRDRLALDDIQRYTADLLEFTSDGREAFMRDRKTQAATIRCLEVIGEATKRLSEQTRELRLDIPWRQIAGLRDVLIHEYERVDLLTVWNVIEQHIPALNHAVRELIARLDSNDELRK